MYRMLFVTNSQSRLNKTLRVAEFTIIGFYFSQFFTKMFECSPVARVWDSSIPGSCLSKHAILNASGLFNLLRDIFILLVPVFSVMKLRIRNAKKAQIIFALTLGAAAPTHNTSNTSYSGHRREPSSEINLSRPNNSSNRRTTHSRASIGLRDGEAPGRAEYIALNSPAEPSTPRERYFISRSNTESTNVPSPAAAPSIGSFRGPPSVVVHCPDSTFPTATPLPNDETTFPSRAYVPPTRHSDTFQFASDGELRRAKPDTKEEKEKFFKHHSYFS
ncbi:hypothetical protein HYALB_00010955 [Hymenoscyphus albidus]|uniref:Rhodopsin domain-containing protein n=1 Tax=Hymenoscyphus albidus TaxID=595503 RepID=A0A9N9LMI6_9HELO|nr:hypothetical protein HYALB_00010955 [Hymenoscyphus albidus]